MKIIFEREWLSVVITVCIATFLSVSLFTPHTIGRGDQLFYLPEIQKQLNTDTALYSDKDLFNYDNPSRYTLYANIIVSLSHAIDKNGQNGLYYSLLILAIISRLIFFTAVYFLIRYFTGSHPFSLLGIFLFIPGDLISQYTFSVVPRTLGFPLGILAITLALIGRPLYGALALAILIPIHVVTAIPFAIAYAAIAVWGIIKGKFSKIELVSGLLVAALGFLSYFLFFSGKGIAVFGALDEEWRQFFLSFAPWFFDRFDSYQVSKILLSGVMFLSSFMIFKKLGIMGERRVEMGILLLVTVFAGLLEIVTAITQIHSFMLLEFYRAFIITRFLAYVFVVAGLFHLWRNRDSFSNRLIFSYTAGMAIFILSLGVESYIFLPFFLYFLTSINNDPFPRKGAIFYALLLMWIFSFGQIGFFFATSEWFYVFYAIYVLVIGSLFALAVVNPNIFAVRFAWPVLSFAFALSILALLFSKGIEVWSWPLLYNSPVAIYGLLALSVLWFLVKNISSQVPGTASPSLVLVLSLYLMAGGVFVAHARPQEPPWQRDNAFNEACQWITSQTPPGALLLTEPFFAVNGHNGAEQLLIRQYDFVRIGCKRSLFFRGSDSNFGHFNRVAALEYVRRKEAVDKVSNTPSMLKNFMTEEQIDYAMSTSELVANLPIVFQNEKIVIYSRQ